MAKSPASTKRNTSHHTVQTQSDIDVLDEVMAAELAELSERFPEIPPEAKTFEQLAAYYPRIPKSPLNKWLTLKVKSGEWMKARKGNLTFYWPVKRE